MSPPQPPDQRPRRAVRKRFRMGGSDGTCNATEASQPQSATGKARFSPRRSDRREADTAEELAERELPPVGRGAARKEALAANPDVASVEAERQLPRAGCGARRAEALGANPDVAAEEARASRGLHGEANGGARAVSRADSKRAPMRSHTIGAV